MLTKIHTRELLRILLPQIDQGECNPGPHRSKLGHHSGSISCPACLIREALDAVAIKKHVLEVAEPFNGPLRIGGLHTLEEIQAEHIRGVLENSEVLTLEDAAEVLGVQSSTLWRVRKRMGLPIAPSRGPRKPATPPTKVTP